MPRQRADRATPSLLDPPTLRTARVARVVPLRPIDRTYSYYVPDELLDRVAPGQRVRVPFGRGDKPVAAFVLDVSDAGWQSTLKPVLDLIDEAPLLDAQLLELGEWIARYYAAHLGRTLDLMVPAAFKQRVGRLRVRHVLLRAESTAADLKLSAKQKRLIDALADAGGELPADALLERAGCTAAVVKALEKRGVVAIETRLEDAPVATPPVERHEPTFELNADQAAAVRAISSAIDARAFSVQVLFGVTGSGKTEVYVAAMRRALSAGRQAMLLVPEIALTTQTVDRLTRRFDRVAVIHSGLSDGERSSAWAAVAHGAVDVVIGTRSAVFAPCPNLGIIIVDEEAEASYKSQASPRYHTRDVAIKRAQLSGIPVVVGSAAPSLETWLNVKTRKHFRLIRLPRRVRGLAMPAVTLVDMRHEQPRRTGIHMLSPTMEDALRDTLARGEQAVLLLNRRGFASYLHCYTCDTTLVCRHCSVNLVFHASTGMAHCHYCHARDTIPARCTTLGCGGKLVRFGMGTQRVEAELEQKFPAARVRRADSDVLQHAGDYASLITAFEKREFDVLVGTQIVAKGLDFPFVSLVGVVSADTALALDDFRSEERTFQLVLQVAGRSGRGDTGGRVVIQTFAADTLPIRHAVRQDYEGFADRELERRRKMELPPFTRMVRVVVADPKASKSRQAAESLAVKMRTLLVARRIAGAVHDAVPSSIQRARDQYRHDVLLVFPDAAAMLAALDLFKDEGLWRASTKGLTVDVDPIAFQ